MMGPRQKMCCAALTALLLLSTGLLVVFQGTYRAAPIQPVVLEESIAAPPPEFDTDYSDWPPLNPDRIPGAGYMPACMDTDMKFTVNGRRHRAARVMDALYHYHHPSGSLLHLVATGSCGAFAGPSTAVYLRANTSDIPVFHDIFFRHTFHFLNDVLGTTEPVTHIMDLGTNVGMSLVYWATHYPKAEIIGVEPELGNFGIAGLNTAHRPNIFLERAAVTDTVGFSNLKNVWQGDWAWGAEKTDKLTSVQGFVSITMPWLLEKHKWTKIDLLKVDIEGSELQLCEEIARGAQWIHTVRCITFEYHDRFVEQPKGHMRVQTTCNMVLKKIGMRFIGHYKVDDLYVWCR